MKRNPLSRTTEPPSPDTTPRSARRRRVIIFGVVGFFTWPAAVFALAQITEGRFPEDPGAAIAYIVLLCVSGLVWFFSCYILYDTLFRMAEALAGGEIDQAIPQPNFSGTPRFWDPSLGKA